MAKACPTPRDFRDVAGTVIYLTFLFFLSFISRFVFSPLIPSIGEDIPITPGQAGTLFFVGAIGALLGSWSSGLVSHLLTHRGVIFVAAFGAAAGLVAGRFAGSFWYLAAVLGVLGFFAGLQTPSSVATITAMVKPDDWGKALSVQQMGPPLGLVASGLAASALLTFFSWRTTLLWVALLCFLVGLGFLAFRGVGYFPGDAPNPTMIGSVVKLRSFWLMMVLFALAMGAQVGVFTMLPLYLTKEHGMATSAANALLGLSNLPPLAMVFVSGWLTDRIGAKRSITFFLFLAGVGVLLAGLLSGRGSLVGIVMVSAFSVGAFPPAFKALSNIVQPNYRAIATALCTPLAFILGGGLLPIGIGLLGESYSLATGLVVVGVIIMVGSLSTVFLKFAEQLEEGC